MSYSRSVPLGGLADWPVTRQGQGPIPGGPTSGDKPAPRQIPIGPSIPGGTRERLSMQQPEDNQQVAGLGDFLMRLMGGGLPIGPGFDESRNFNDNMMVPGRGMGGGPPVPPLRIPNGLFQRGQAPLIGQKQQGGQGGGLADMFAGWPRSHHIG